MLELETTQGTVFVHPNSILAIVPGDPTETDTDARASRCRVHVESGLCFVCESDAATVAAIVNGAL